MKISRAVRIGAYSAILLCLAVAEYSARSNSSSDQSGRVLPRHTLSGDIRVHKNFYSKLLANSREVIVYLPPGYDDERSVRYPVLYMQDGQNAFDAATSFFASGERHMDEEAQQLIARHEIQPLIIVGVYSIPAERINEFTPVRDSRTNRGGGADLYGRMLVEEVKPFIDATYRTKAGRANTALGGSSLGGLVTMHLGLRYANVFGKLAITSPGAYWADEEIVQEVESLRARTDQRICLSVGTGEPAVFLNSTRDLRRALIDKGWKEGVDLGYMEAPAAQHGPDERSHRTTHLLTFLFPANR
jgi:predicted alpha/beta superfamily hydrolase